MKSYLACLVTALLLAVFTVNIIAFNLIINKNRFVQQQRVVTFRVTTSHTMTQNSLDKQSNGFVRKCISTIAAMSVLFGSSQHSMIAASAAEKTNTAEVAVSKTSPKFYWGVGCFWHVQHEFVEAEKRILGRSDSELTVGQLASSSFIVYIA